MQKHQFTVTIVADEEGLALISTLFGCPCCTILHTELVNEELDDSAPILNGARDPNVRPRPRGITPVNAVTWCDMFTLAENCNFIVDDIRKACDRAPAWVDISTPTIKRAIWIADAAQHGPEHFHAKLMQLKSSSQGNYTTAAQLEARKEKYGW